jgi:hypothetical protein
MSSSNRTRTTPDPAVARYQSHETALAQAIEGQDLSWKFEIPVRERLSVLQNLDRYNINAFSLYGGDDALVRTVGFRMFDLRFWDAS